MSLRRAIQARRDRRRERASPPTLPARWRRGGSRSDGGGRRRGVRRAGAPFAARCDIPARRSVFCRPSLVPSRVSGTAKAGERGNQGVRSHGTQGRIVASPRRSAALSARARQLTPQAPEREGVCTRVVRHRAGSVGVCVPSSVSPCSLRRSRRPRASAAQHLGDRTLHKGDRGHDVRVLQDFLTRAGYATPIAGIFGPQTLRNVRRFQRAHHMTVDGVVGAGTSRALRTIAARRAHAQQRRAGGLRRQLAAHGRPHAQEGHARPRRPRAAGLPLAQRRFDAGRRRVRTRDPAQRAAASSARTA